MLVKAKGRITAEAIEEIRKRVKNHESTHRVSKALGVSQHAVRYHTLDIPKTQIFDKKLSVQTIEEIREKVRNRLSKYEVSEISDLSYSTVCKYIKDIQGCKCNYLGHESEKFLLTIMKDGFFIAKKGHMRRATVFYRILLRNGFKIKYASVHRKLAIYFPEGRDVHAFKAFLKAGEEVFGKRTVSRWLSSGITKRFEIPKKDYKRVLTECGYKSFYFSKTLQRHA
ncbi:MAG: hypothetical protein MUP55_02045 [Candidatus Aenigmarchaeota archaeon]|nr:hypothetical protein [Candidatus Aenigmarchaeota archaeon]